jgi:hypothetical protein
MDRSGEKGVAVTLDEMITNINAKRRSDDLISQVARADLYIKRHDGTELFFEIKSPKPNKGQCLEVMQRILRIYTISGSTRPVVQAFYGMAYNPWGYDSGTYKWGYPRKYMDFASTVVIGADFWTLISGPGTYEELLAIYREVGAAKSKHIVDSLAFGLA